MDPYEEFVPARSATEPVCQRCGTAHRSVIRRQDREVRCDVCDGRINELPPVAEAATDYEAETHWEK